jgi:hypothetical protein
VHSDCGRAHVDHRVPAGDARVGKHEDVVSGAADRQLPPLERQDAARCGPADDMQRENRDEVGQRGRRAEAQPCSRSQARVVQRRGRAEQVGAAPHRRVERCPHCAREPRKDVREQGSVGRVDPHLALRRRERDADVDLHAAQCGAGRRHFVDPSGSPVDSGAPGPCRPQATRKARERVANRG